MSVIFSLLKIIYPGIFRSVLIKVKQKQVTTNWMIFRYQLFLIFQLSKLLKIILISIFSLFFMKTKFSGQTTIISDSQKMSQVLFILELIFLWQPISFKIIWNFHWMQNIFTQNFWTKQTSKLTVKESCGLQILPVQLKFLWISQNGMQVLAHHTLENVTFQIWT